MEKQAGDIREEFENSETYLNKKFPMFVPLQSNKSELSLNGESICHR
ncbi:MAG: hypothetical protein PHS82_06645 [Lachnospiraceae bacterium]|nr:hypothetical protein [Lachnospiraceae bacterium]